LISGSVDRTFLVSSVSGMGANWAVGTSAVVSKICSVPRSTMTN